MTYINQSLIALPGRFLETLRAKVYSKASLVWAKRHSKLSWFPSVYKSDIDQLVFNFIGFGTVGIVYKAIHLFITHLRWKEMKQDQKSLFDIIGQPSYVFYRDPTIMREIDATVKIDT